LKVAFQSFWHGNNITPYEQLCIQSFLDNNHDFIVYSYDKLENIPAGAILKDAEEILTKDELFTYKHGHVKGSYAGFANYFRYELLYRKGGWWVDMDVLCLTPSLPSNEIFIAFESNNSINNAILRFPSGHKLMKNCRDEAKRIGKNAKFAEAGPILLTKLIDTFGFHENVSPSYTAYPIPYDKALDVLIPECANKLLDVVQESTFIHLWGSVLRRAGISKNISPPFGSLLRILFDKHSDKIIFPLGQYEAEALSIQKDLYIEIDELRTRTKVLNSLLLTKVELTLRRIFRKLINFSTFTSNKSKTT